VDTESWGTSIEAVGTAYANQSVDVTSKVANTITSLRFAEGSLVRRGTVLVEFDRAQTAADLEVAEALSTDSERQYRRSQELFATQALSRSNLDQLEATLKANRARVASARARLDDTVIRAPFDGRTGFRLVSLGSLVSPGTVITTLDDTSSIKLDFTVPETFMPYVQPRQSIVARSVALPGHSFNGFVTTLGSRVDMVTRSITARAVLPNKEGLLRPGLFMTVTLQSDVRPALVISEQALVTERGASFVFVVDNAIALRRDVKTGRRQVGKVEIVAGLSAGENIVVDGVLKIRDGLPVHPVPAVLNAASQQGGSAGSMGPGG
jgi:membrane fusion protein (multidrug efflux system)